MPEEQPATPESEAIAPQAMESPAIAPDTHAAAVTESEDLGDAATSAADESGAVERPPYEVVQYELDEVTFEAVESQALTVDPVPNRAIEPDSAIAWDESALVELEFGTPEPGLDDEELAIAADTDSSTPDAVEAPITTESAAIEATDTVLPEPAPTAAEPIAESSAEPIVPEAATGPDTGATDTPSVTVEPEVVPPVAEAPAVTPEPSPQPEAAIAPPPEPPISQAPATPPPTRTAQSKTLQTLQAFWRTAQPKLKAGTIQTLKITIQVLQWGLARLEAEPGQRPNPERPSAKQRLQLPDWVNQIVPTVQAIWQRFWPWWKSVLPKLRAILPAAINEKLSDDRVLTGAIAGILVLVLWVVSALGGGQPSEPVAIAPSPKASPVQPAKPAPTKEKKDPKSKPAPEVKVIPPPKSTVSPEPTAAKPALPLTNPEPTKPTAEAPKPQPTPAVTPTPIARPTMVPSPQPSPPPLKLTPEQALIARIQDQVAEVSNQYVNGLIQSVQANFRASRLTVKLGDGWYSLSPTQQDSLANDILKRAQQLNFIKLELADTQGTVLARSPVVGSEAIVLQRSLT